MKPRYWAIDYSHGMLCVRTPWIGLCWSEYAKAPLEYGWWRGVEIYWKRTNDIREGDCYYQRSRRFCSDFLPYLEAL